MAKKTIEKEENIEEVEAKSSKALTLDEAIKIIECPGVHVRRPQPGSVAEAQLFYFASQPKVRYRLARAAGERLDAFETDVTNDLMITFQKGVNLDMPEDIAKYFDDSLGITMPRFIKGLQKM